MFAPFRPIPVLPKCRVVIAHSQSEFRHCNNSYNNSIQHTRQQIIQPILATRQHRRHNHQGRRCRGRRDTPTMQIMSRPTILAAMHMDRIHPLESHLHHFVRWCSQPQPSLDHRSVPAAPLAPQSGWMSVDRQRCWNKDLDHSRVRPGTMRRTGSKWRPQDSEREIRQQLRIDP